MITNGYTTLAAFQARTGKTNNQLSDDTELIEREIERNSREIDRITGKRFYLQTLTNSKVVWGFGENSDGLRMSEDGCRIYFPSEDFTISAITSNNEAITEDEDYYTGHGFIEAESAFSSERKYGVKITGTTGSNTIPADVERICLAMTEVTTGLGTYTMIDSTGTKVDVTRDNLPDWVADSLFRHVRFDCFG